MFAWNRGAIQWRGKVKHILEHLHLFWGIQCLHIQCICTVSHFLMSVFILGHNSHPDIHSIQQQRTSGYWILTMKLQRAHYNGGEGVASCDENHRLITLAWKSHWPRALRKFRFSFLSEVTKMPNRRHGVCFINAGVNGGQRRPYFDSFSK